MSCLRTRQIPRVVLSHSDPWPSSSMCETLSLNRPSRTVTWKNFAVSQRVQAAAESADPQRAVRAFHQGTNLIARKAVGDGVEAKLARSH